MVTHDNYYLADVVKYVCRELSDVEAWAIKTNIDTTAGYEVKTKVTLELDTKSHFIFG